MYFSLRARTVECAILTTYAFKRCFSFPSKAKAETSASKQPVKIYLRFLAYLTCVGLIKGNSTQSY